MLLEEFDPNPSAVINPADVVRPVPGLPKVGVSCFSHRTFARMADALSAEECAATGIAGMHLPVCRAAFCGTELALFLAPVGAPACVSVLEDLFAMGLEKLVLFGNCGVLDRAIGDCSVIIPTAALRDEGTSFHYAPAADEIEVNPRYREAFLRILDGHGCGHTLGKTWTTDGAYRETREKVARRREAGCVCVEMECAAVAALAAFRGKEVFQFFYAGDNLDAERWEARSLSGSAKLPEKDRVALLALELAQEMGRQV